MANRIILGAVVALALTFSPVVAFSVPTKDVKKKSPSKSQNKVSNKSKAGKKSKTANRSGRADRETSAAVRGELAGLGESGSVEKVSKGSGSAVSETPPLMKVTPQRDGRFLLEPLGPKKKLGALSGPTSKAEPTKEAESTTSRSYARFEPWNFSDLILTQAKHYRDTPYARGGSLQSGSATDCSGFVQYIYQGFKIDLPRSSAEQAQVGKVAARTMDFSKLLPGDLLFFSRGGRHVGHAGIYLGEGKMIHASNHRLGVTVTDLRQPYYEGTFVVAKRVFEVKYPQ
jgi:cell wall-associated NlpC family hydrolase